MSLVHHVYTAAQVKTAIQHVSDAKRAASLQWFFKTGKGEYGYGDKFVGVTVPKLRVVAKAFATLPTTEITKLLTSRIHEHRMVALFILVAQFTKSPERQRRELYDYYLAHTHNINNWDLVDLSAPKIVGGYLIDKDKSILYSLARSASLWERRIAVLATSAFINRGDYADIVAIAQLLLADKSDLIHKAVGWMLREVGKKDLSVLTDFLDKYCTQMPRVMLRYSIEKLPQRQRQNYLSRR